MYVYFRSGFTLERTRRARRSSGRNGFQQSWLRWFLFKCFNPNWLQVEARLAKKEGGWLVGNSLTWADLYLFHYITSWAVAIPDLLKPLPNCQKLVEDVKEIPQLKDWIAIRPKTAMWSDKNIVYMQLHKNILFMWDSISYLGDLNKTIFDFIQVNEKMVFNGLSIFTPKCLKWVKITK